MDDRRSAQKETIYFALMGDVVGSREMEDRASVQRELRDTLDELNRELSGDVLAASLQLTAGDEIQALLSAPEAAVDILVRLADRLHPAALVWGLGAGEIATDLDPDVAVLDGPCFHRAREALGTASDDETWLGVRGFPSPHGEVLSTLFRLLRRLRADWTETQARYVREARERLQKEVAAQFGVHESSVSKVLRAASFREIEAGERAARELLAWLGRRVRSGAAEGEPVAERPVTDAAR